MIGSLEQMPSTLAASGASLYLSFCREYTPTGGAVPPVHLWAQVSDLLRFKKS